jgi:hypothetical protein
MLILSIAATLPFAGKFFHSSKANNNTGCAKFMGGLISYTCLSPTSRAKCSKDLSQDFSASAGKQQPGSWRLFK